MAFLGAALVAWVRMRKNTTEAEIWAPLHFCLAYTEINLAEKKTQLSSPKPPTARKKLESSRITGTLTPANTSLFKPVGSAKNCYPRSRA